MKQVTIILTFILIIGVATAAQANVTLIDDIGSFSGAVLKLRSPTSDEMGDKIYAYKYLTNVGIVKFKIETALPQVFLNFMMTKNGMVVDEFEEGPFSVNGSEILIDRRVKIAVPNQNVSPENITENITEEIVEENITEEIIEDIPREVVIDGTQNDSQESRFSKVILTGNAVVENVGDVKLGVAGLFLLVLSAVFVLMMAKRKKKASSILSEDDKELSYMEKKVKATEAKLSQIKQEREKRKKLEEIKEKLEREEKELAELEGKEGADTEKIEGL